jgi:hypothetical protein
MSLHVINYYFIRDSFDSDLNFKIYNYSKNLNNLELRDSAKIDLKSRLELKIKMELFFG